MEKNAEVLKPNLKGATIPEIPIMRRTNWITTLHVQTKYTYAK